uniref:Coiled-coil domain-containing protein 28B n=1 Tax=Lygus hesperus TaxID=30085 RepID=A0A0A9Z731_LYGHE
MSEEREPNDLQQFLMEEDSNARKYSEVTPPISPGVSKQDICSSTGGGCSLRGGISQGSSICSKSLCRIATAPTIGSTHASNSSGTRFAFLNEKMNNRPARPAHPPPPNRIKRDVTDVRRMETALLSLLEDFHSGNLRAFGKDCSMEQMTGIREQQERLAKLHFELGASQELFAPLSEEGLSQGKQNMSALMSSLEQLSESIEKLHSFSSQHD